MTAPLEEEKSQEAKARKVWGRVPTCFWLEESLGKPDVLRVIQHPIDRNIHPEIHLASVKFGGIVLCDSMDHLYDNKQMRSYLLCSNGFRYAERKKSHLSNVKYMLQEIYVTTGTRVLVVLYDGSDLQVDKASDVYDLMGHFPTTDGFFMLWIYGEDKEYFTVIGARQFAKKSSTGMLTQFLSPAELEHMSKL